MLNLRKSSLNPNCLEQFLKGFEAKSEKCSWNKSCREISNQ